MEDVALTSPGLQLATSKCLDRCKQGPALQVEARDGGPVDCVSKDKPAKKEKKKVGNNLVTRLSTAFSRTPSTV